MKINSYANAVKALEGFAYGVAAPPDLEVDVYPYAKRAPGSWTVTKFLESTRIASALRGYKADLFLPDGTVAHGRMLLKNLREAYGA